MENTIDMSPVELSLLGTSSLISMLARKDKNSPHFHYEGTVIFYFTYSDYTPNNAFIQLGDNLKELNDFIHVNDLHLKYEVRLNML